MSSFAFTKLVLRQAEAEEQEAPIVCSSGNEYDGRLGLRVSAIFVILLTSTFGALFPVIAKKNPTLKVPEWCYFLAKYFGSGVIIATAFIHLLTPANEALTNPCLSGVIADYPWAQGIALMAVFSLFFLELLVMRYASFAKMEAEMEASDDGDKHTISNMGGYAAQLTSIFILEFGVVFHSIFIGLTLAVSSMSEFNVLYVVLVFHQMFEGLGLGARLAVTPFPPSKNWTPYVMAIGYGLSTPLAIAIGLGVRTTYPPESETTLIVNGIFDAVSAGILLYTGLVELMAHEFLFNQELRNAKASTMFLAFFWMVLGAALMALLGKWA